VPSDEGCAWVDPTSTSTAAFPCSASLPPLPGEAALTTDAQRLHGRGRNPKLKAALAPGVGKPATELVAPLFEFRNLWPSRRRRTGCDHNGAAFRRIIHALRGREWRTCFANRYNETRA